MLDPDGSRTLELITKPDILDRGSERFYVELLEIKMSNLVLGGTYYATEATPAAMPLLPNVTRRKWSSSQLVFRQLSTQLN